MNDLLNYIIIFLFAFASSLVFNKLILKFSKTLGIREKDTTIIRWSEVSKPSVGGISFYVIFLLLLITCSILFQQSSFFTDLKSIGLIISVSLAFIMGLADDAYDTKPLLKFSIQVLISIVLIWTDNYIKIFSFDWGNYLLTFFWMVGIMNSINMLDNMDGITTVTSIFIVINVLLILGIKQEFGTMLYTFLIGIVGVLIGFLRYNWNPAKMFMGDTGSQFLGALLGIIGINFIWNDFTTTEGYTAEARQLVLVINVFLIPIVDTTIVFVNRLKRKQSPFIGGKDHTTHNLVYSGLNERQVAYTFIGISLFTLLITYLIFTQINEWTHVFTISYLLIFIGILSYFFYLTNKYKKHYT